jgi:galactose oxidase
VVVNRNGEIWAKATDDAQGNWRPLLGTAHKVVAWNGRSFWAIGLDSNIYRSDGVGAWVYVGRNVQDLAASSDGGGVTVNRTTKAIWRKFSDNTVEA